MLDSASFIRFFRPAMSFNEHYETNGLKNIASFNGIFSNSDSPTLEESNYNYLFACNETSTKAILVKQPKLAREEMNGERSSCQSS